MLQLISQNCSVWKLNPIFLFCMNLKTKKWTGFFQVMQSLIETPRSMNFWSFAKFCKIQIIRYFLQKFSKIHATVCKSFPKFPHILQKFFDLSSMFFASFFKGEWKILQVFFLDRGTYQFLALQKCHQHLICANLKLSARLYIIKLRYTDERQKFSVLHLHVSCETFVQIVLFYSILRNLTKYQSKYNW